MKRLLASLCCAFLLAGTVPFLAATGEPEKPSSPVVDDPTTDPSGTESTNNTEPTVTTPQPIFTFIEHSRDYNEVTGELTVSWGCDGDVAVTVEGVIVDNTRYSVSASDNSFSANVGRLSTGSHSLTYVLRLSNGSTVEQVMSPLVLNGAVLRLRLSMSVENNVVTVYLTDEAGRAVPAYPLHFLLNGSTGADRVTDQDGQVVMRVSGDLRTVNCTAAERTVGNITYISASADWKQTGNEPVSQPQTTVSEEPDITTTTRTRWSASTPTRTTGTVQTYATIQGAGTTAIEGNNIAVNVSFDEGVVDAFGLEEEDFNKRARLLMGADLYRSLVGDTKATVMMTLGYSAFDITDQHISKLVSGKSKYSRYADIKRVAVNMGLEFVDENQRIVPIQMAPEGSYTVRLPVPESMVDCPVLAVAVIEQDGLSHLMDVQVKNGYLQFVTNGFTSIAVLGFGDHAMRTGGGVAWQLIVLLTAGVLMLAGAGLLMFFFVWRKPTALPADGVADEEPVEADMTTFMLDQIEPQENGTLETINNRPDEQPEEDGQDLYSSDSRRPHNE